MTAHDNRAYEKLVQDVATAIQRESEGPYRSPSVAALYEARAAVAVIDAYLGMAVTEFPESQWKAGYRSGAAEGGSV